MRRSLGSRFSRRAFSSCAALILLSYLSDVTTGKTNEGAIRHRGVGSIVVQRTSRKKCTTRTTTADVADAVAAVAAKRATALVKKKNTAPPFDPERHAYSIWVFSRSRIDRVEAGWKFRLARAQAASTPPRISTFKHRIYYATRGLSVFLD